MQYKEVSAKSADGINQVFLDLAIEINKTHSSKMEMALGLDDQVRISDNDRIGAKMSKKKKLKGGASVEKTKKGKCC